ncbi:queuosine precursor transporter [Candidatus Woesebacteria bacterium]|nr:queuosine precursor transporter [Candidatus Woesebacteria bacterium]
MKDIFAIKKLDLLISLYVFCVMVAELMGNKTFPLGSIGGFPLNASVAIFVIPILFSINDVITEVYGAERTRSVVGAGLIVIICLILFSLLATALPPSTRSQPMEAEYDSVFLVSVRISIASLIAFLSAHLMDIAIFSKLREKLGEQGLWLRNNLSNFIAQFFDTFIFITLAFYALNKSFEANALFLAGLILPYWLLKCLLSVVETPLVYLGVRWLKKD